MNGSKKILLLMLSLLIIAEILFKANVTEKSEMILARLSSQIQGDLYRVDCGACDEVILPWSNAEGQKYLFLPSSSRDYEKVKGDISGEESDIRVIRSAEVASVFVVLENDTLETVDENKGYLASGYVTIINADGEIEYSKDLEYIKSRGNGTYNTEKKPYEIKLTHSKSLLGMSAAKEWILLANAYDCSLIKNSLVQDFAANHTDLPSAANKPVDLYINGEYRGSYLLSEKVQVRDGYIEINDLEKRNSAVNGENANIEYQQVSEGDISYVAEIDSPKDITGGYLVEMVPQHLLDDSLSYFYTNNGTLFKLKHPKYASEEEVRYIKGIFDEVEMAVSADDGVNPYTGRHYSQIIDVDTWVQKYLLELVFQNSDMSYASMYFYKDSDSIDSKLHAGMPWDYDLCLENTRNADSFPFVNQMYLREELLRFEEVQNTFEHVYETMFVPFVKKDLDIYLSQKEQELTATYNMNAIRWEALGKTNDFTRGYSALAANVDFLSRKMKDSIGAMNKWIYRKDNYYVVSFLDNYQHFLVEKGTKPNFEAPNYADYIALFAGWEDAEGKLYDKEMIVTDDLVYHASVINITEIFLADESELKEMDFSNVSSELLEKIVVGLRNKQSGNEVVPEFPDLVLAVSIWQDDANISLKQGDDILQTISVPKGSTFKDIPVPGWEDGIFLRWRRVDNNEFLNENIYILEPATYEAEWIYIPYLIENGLALSGKSIDEIDIEMLENVFEKNLE